MPLLMAAADCLIQNAGGMTCHEAAEAKLPVIFFRPIPGHGEMNARVMAEAGASSTAVSEEALSGLLHAVIVGDATLSAPPPRDGSTVVAEILLAARLGARTSPPEPKALAIGRRIAVLVAVLAGLFWLTGTPWPGPVGGVLTPRGISANDFPAGSVALVMRADDPAVAQAVEATIAGEGLPIALFVEGRGSIGIEPRPGVTVGFTLGESSTILLHPRRAWQHERRASAMVQQMSGDGNVYILMPHRSGSLLSSLMMPDGAVHLYGVLAGNQNGTRGIVIINTHGMTPLEAVDLLHQELHQIEEEGLQCVPLSSLH